MVCLENVLKISLQDVLKMSWRRLEDTLKRSWRCFEASWRRLKNVFKMPWQDILKTSWKRLEDVLKTYGHDEYIGVDEDVLKTSSEDARLRRTYSSWSRRLEDDFKTSSEDGDERRLLKTETKDVFKTSSSRQMFAGNIWTLIC